MVIEEKVVITGEMVGKFAELVNDHNQIHVDDEYAKGTVFGGRIAHGMLVGSLFSGVLARNFPGCIYVRQELDFRKPIKVGSTVTVSVEHVSTTTDGSKKSMRYGIECMVKRDDGEVAVIGNAMISVR